MAADPKTAEEQAAQSELLVDRLRRETKGSQGHHIEWLAPNAYAISWEIDKNAMGSRLRFPIRRRSVTDRKGAERFAAKWGLVVPKGKR